jgi:hypothetical protein
MDDCCYWIWIVYFSSSGMHAICCTLNLACYWKVLKVDPLSALTGTGMLGSQFLRGLSILIGGAVVFGGLSISFFQEVMLIHFLARGENLVAVKY